MPESSAPETTLPTIPGQPAEAGAEKSPQVAPELGNTPIPPTNNLDNPNPLNTTPLDKNSNKKDAEADNAIITQSFPVPELPNMPTTPKPENPIPTSTTTTDQTKKPEPSI